MNEITKELLEVLKSIMTLPDHKVDRRDEAKAARAATRERLFVLTWTDRYGERRGPLRHYLHLDTAAARATQLLITSGAPGDVAELAHLWTGMQLGWAKVSVNGTISCGWDWT